MVLDIAHHTLRSLIVYYNLCMQCWTCLGVVTLNNLTVCLKVKGNILTVRVGLSGRRNVPGVKVYISENWLLQSKSFWSVAGDRRYLQCNSYCIWRRKSVESLESIFYNTLRAALQANLCYSTSIYEV